MADSKVVVELRVHGVSGTPPEALLGCPSEFLEREAGDKSAGFYRRPPWIDDAAAGPPVAWRRVLEAYSWGGLTSGPASRAVWLLFLPFIFINLAHWMLPPATKQRRSAAISVGLLRLVALSFTLTLMLAAAVAAMDVMVWQCMGLDYCGSELGPLSFMVSLPRGVQVALSAVPLVVVIAVLWRLGRENTRVIGRPPNPAVMADEIPLESDTFWWVDPSVLRLRACHVMAWTAGLAALTLAVPARYAASSSVHAVGVGLLVANGVDPGHRRADDGVEPGDGARRDERRLADASVAAAAMGVGWSACRVVGVGRRRADIAYPPAPTHFPGLRGAIYALLGVQVVLLIALFIFTALSMRGRRSTPATADVAFGRAMDTPDAWRVHRTVRGIDRVAHRRRVQRRRGPVDRAGSRQGGAVHRGGTYRNCGQGRHTRSDTAGFEAKAAALNADAPLIVPPPYFWAAMAIAMLIIAAVLTGIGVWWWITRKRARDELRSVLADHPGHGSETERAGRTGGVQSRAWASLTDLGAPIVAGLAMFAVAVIAVLAGWYLSDSGGFESLPGYSPAITNASVFITVSLATGLVALAVQAYRDRQTPAGRGGAVGRHHLLAAREPPADAAVLRRAHGARAA